MTIPTPGWRTYTINGAAGGAAFLEILAQIAHLPEFLHVMPPGTAPYVLFAVAVINLILRRSR